MLKNNKPLIAILSVLIIVLFIWSLDRNKPNTNTQQSQVAAYTPSQLSFASWQNFSAAAQGLKRNVQFLYPKEWVGNGPNAGDSSVTFYFLDSNKNSPAWTSQFTGSTTAAAPAGAVLIMRIAAKPQAGTDPLLLYNFLKFNPYTEVYKKEIVIDKKVGVIISRDVTFSNGEKRREYWAIFPDVDGVAYEFAMRGDIYANSEEAFSRVIQNVTWGANVK